MFTQPISQTFLVDIRYMFVKWCMKEWMESLALASAFVSKIAQFSTSSKRQAQPLALLNFSTVIQANFLDLSR